MTEIIVVAGSSGKAHRVHGMQAGPSRISERVKKSHPDGLSAKLLPNRMGQDPAACRK